MSIGQGPAGRSDRGVRHLEGDPGPVGGSVETRQGGTTGVLSLVHATGQREGLDKQSRGLDAAEPLRPDQDLDGGGQRSSLERLPAREHQEGAGAGLVPGLEGEVGRQVPPRALEAGMLGIDGRQGKRRKVATSRWQQALQDGVSSQSMAEGEGSRLEAEQLDVHASLQRAPHELRRLARRSRQEPPVEPPPEHGRAGEDRALLLGESRQTGAHRLGKRGRNPRGGEQLLDQEGDAVRAALDPVQDLVSRVREAHSHHLRDRRPLQPLQPEVPAGAPTGDPAQLARGGWLVRPRRGHAQDPCPGQVVAQVVDHRPGVGIRPVQVLEDEQQASRLGQTAQQLDGGLRLHRGGGLDYRQSSQGRHDPGEHRPPGIEVGVRGWAPKPQDLQQRLGERPVGSRVTAGHRPTGGDREPLRPRHRARLLH